MARRFNRSLHPVNSIKHILDSQGVLASGNQSATPIIVAVPNVDTTTFKPGDVRVGSHVNGIYLSVFMLGASGGGLSGSLNWLMYKEHEGQAAQAPDPANAGVSMIRNQIIHQEKGLAGSADGTPMVFKGVIKIPKSMRRMREGDTWFIRFVNTDAVNDANFCLQTIYKSYF